MLHQPVRAAQAPADADGRPGSPTDGRARPTDGARDPVKMGRMRPRRSRKKRLMCAFICCEWSPRLFRPACGPVGRLRTAPASCAPSSANSRGKVLRLTHCLKASPMCTAGAPDCAMPALRSDRCGCSRRRRPRTPPRSEATTQPAAAACWEDLVLEDAAESGPASWHGRAAAHARAR